jgi:hypothetical protein
MPDPQSHSPELVFGNLPSQDQSRCYDYHALATLPSKPNPKSAVDLGFGMITMLPLPPCRQNQPNPKSAVDLRFDMITMLPLPPCRQNQTPNRPWI